MTDWRQAHDDLREKLAAHFILWENAPDRTGGTWVCACGKRFGFSDSAIDHQAAALLATPAPEAARCVCDGAMWFSDKENAIRHPFLISADCAIHSPTPINTPAPDLPTTVQADDTITKEPDMTEPNELLIEQRAHLTRVVRGLEESLDSNHLGPVAELRRLQKAWNARFEDLTPEDEAFIRTHPLNPHPGELDGADWWIGLGQIAAWLEEGSS